MSGRLEDDPGAEAGAALAGADVRGATELAALLRRMTAESGADPEPVSASPATPATAATAALARELRTVEFPVVRVGARYDPSQVDDLLDRIVAALLADEPVRDLLGGAGPDRVRLGRGYRRAEVDAVLADAGRRARG